jgi:transcriptional regulator of NAD metabolism
MKKLKVLLTFLILGIIISAQPYNQQDVVSTNTMNSSVTALDSAEVFTGKAEAVLYTSAITVLIRSDVGGTGSAQFSSNGTNWDLKEPFTYTASDSLQKYLFTVTAKYFRLIYTNGTTDQTYFRLQTIFHKTMISPLTDNRLDFNLPPAASDTMHQDQIIEAIDTTNVRVTLLHGVLQDVEDRQVILQDSINILNATQLILEGLTEDLIQDADTANARLSVVNNLLQDVEDRQVILQDSLNVLNATQLIIKGLLTLSNTKLDSIFVNVKEGNTLVEQIETELLAVGIDVDSTLTNLKENNLLTEQIETELLLIGIDADSTLTNLKENNYLLQQLDNNTDLLEQGIDSVNAETERIHLELIKKLSQTTGDSIEVNIEELDYIAQHIDDNTDGLEAKADSTLENLKETNTLLQTIRTATTSILYGQSTIVNQLLDDAPTSYTSAGFEIGSKKKVSFVLVYDETETGGGVSGAVTLEVSPDNSNWYALNAFYNNAGTIVSTVNYTADATDTFHLPEFVTYPYIRATFTGTATDVDDTIQINIILCWQSE